MSKFSISLHLFHSRSDSTNSKSQNNYYDSYNRTNESLLHDQTEMPMGDDDDDIDSDEHSTASSHLSAPTPPKQQRRSSSCVDTDLETLDRELNALDASMPLVDPEITQGAEQLEKAISSSRKRSRSEEDNDRLVREALSQFYLPSPRLLSGIDDCPLLLSPSPEKRCKTSASTSAATSHMCSDLIDFDLDHNQNQKEFEVIMDALRLGSSGSGSNDSCGQAAMMCENGVFHNLVVASLET